MISETGFDFDCVLSRRTVRLTRYREASGPGLNKPRRRGQSALAKYGVSPVVFFAGGFGFSRAAWLAIAFLYGTPGTPMAGP